MQFITLYSFLIRKEKSLYEKNYLIINNWKQGIYKDKYSSIVYYKDNKLHGPRYDWCDNEQLSIKCHYKNDILHGSYYLWNYYGQLWIKYYYKNNNLHGKYYMWDKNGNLIENSTYNNGIKIEN